MQTIDKTFYDELADIIIAKLSPTLSIHNKLYKSKFNIPINKINDISVIANLILYKSTDSKDKLIEYIVSLRIYYPKLVNDSGDYKILYESCVSLCNQHNISVKIKDYLDIMKNLKFSKLKCMLVDKNEYDEHPMGLLNYLRCDNIVLNCEECCVCYESCKSVTNCGHYVCYKCLDKMTNDSCPMCKKSPIDYKYYHLFDYQRCIADIDNQFEYYSDLAEDL